jgi:hypothetical protein
VEKNQVALDRHKTRNSITRVVNSTHWLGWIHHAKLIHFTHRGSDIIAGAQSPGLIFPTTAIFSYSSASLTGGLAESTLVGNEGIVGLWLLSPKTISTVSASLQTPGFGIVVAADFLNREISHSSEFRQTLLNHANASVWYATQTCFCYRHHTIEQQVSKTILLTLLRTGRDEVQMSHQMIAGVLGIRREAVSTALKHLQKLNLIEQKRCSIVVRQPTALVSKACECYPLIRAQLGHSPLAA